MTLARVIASRHIWALIAFGVGVFCAGYILKATQKPPDAKFILDMSVPPLGGPPWAVDLYVNNLIDEPARVTVNGGIRYRYEFPCKVRTVNFLRLDPVQVLDVEVGIHSLVLELNGVVIHRFTPSELKTWTTGQPGRIENDVFFLSGAKSVNHIETSSLNIPVPLPSHLISWGDLIPVEWLDRYMLILSAMFIASLLFGLSDRRYRFYLLLLPFMTLAIVAGNALSRNVKGSLNASAAISVATYAGVTKTRDLYTLIILTMIPVVSALLVWGIFLWRGGIQEGLPEVSSSTIPPSKHASVPTNKIPKRTEISRRSWGLLAIITGVTGAGFLWKALHRPQESKTSRDAKFILDMTVPALTVPPWGVDLYMNNLVDQPARVQVHGGTRFRYEFPCKFQTVDFLRLDPVQVLDVEVVIHSLDLEVDGVVVRRFMPEELRTWNTGQPGKVENGALLLKGLKNVNHIEKSGLDLHVHAATK